MKVIDEVKETGNPNLKSMQKRLQFIDITKCIAIIGIISVHIPSGSVLSISETFHVSSFFMIVGIIFSLRDVNNLSLSKEINKKAKGLMFPYFMLSICNICMMLILNLITGWGKNVMLIEGVLKTVSFRGIGTLWFLPVLFFGEILFLCIVKCLRKEILKKFFLPLALLMCLFILYFPQTSVEQYVSCIDYSNIFFGDFSRWILLFFISILACVAIISIGYCLGRTIEKISDQTFKSNIIVALIFIVTITIDIWLHRYYHCDLHKGTLSPILVYLGCSISGSISVIMLSILLPQLNYKVSNALEWFGRNSLIVMATHKEFFIVHVMYLCAINMHTNAFLASLFTTIMTIIVEVVIIYVVNKTVLKKFFYFR